MLLCCCFCLLGTRNSWKKKLSKHNIFLFSSSAALYISVTGSESCEASRCTQLECATHRTMLLHCCCLSLGNEKHKTFWQITMTGCIVAMLLLHVDCYIVVMLLFLVLGMIKSLKKDVPMPLLVACYIVVMLLFLVASISRCVWPVYIFWVACPNCLHFLFLQLSLP